MKRSIISICYHSYKLRKLIHFTFLIVGFPLWLIASLCLHIIKPFIHIRIGMIMSDHFGHFNTSYALHDASKQLDNKKTIDIYFLSHPNRISNKHMLKLVKRQLIIFQWIEFVYIVNKIFPNNNQFEKQLKNHIFDIKISYKF